VKLIEKINRCLNQLLTVLAGCCLVVLITMTSANVVLRIFGRAIPGTFELMGYLGALIGALALGQTQIKRGHISVDILVNTFSPKVKAWLQVVNSAVCALLFAGAAWQIGRLATILKNTGEVTETLRIIYYPFIYAVAVGFGTLTLVMIGDLLRVLMGRGEGQP
jgi:TRAP-type C4-dicarboxylate transport system permease small subunit